MTHEQHRKKHQRKMTRLLVLEVVLLMSVGFVLSLFLQSISIDTYGLIERAFSG